ncbi:tRNA threonylcarbamoyladenosine biosynthesis protein TsaB [Planctomycetes bacterium Poly30]|uniref:tRNA threonylcarbamoyladenosine biosynthesis protein TsaB n=1 Tax=Saltatorellus ferox TaxID=2528018 RepID=A0A518EQD5_9BACT|nr:tRNA threonylcarbamoyladenosine biosynthesis protein TsaB [Planctomycetes bacterium Poly30]
MPRLAVALETSSRPSSIAVSIDGGPPRLSSLDESKSHASDLLPLLDEIVRSAGAEASDIERIVVGTGPGSYTGLRVGSSTALGLSIGLSGEGSGPELLGISSFEALAYAALRAGERAAVLRNAFGGSVYLAAYGRSLTGLIQFQEPICCAAEEAVEILGSERIWLADDGALKAIDAVIPESRRGSMEVRSEDPNAAALLSLGALESPTKGTWDEHRGADGVKPLYLRAFEAKLRRR